MNEAKRFEVEHGDVTLLRLHAPPTGLLLTDQATMGDLMRVLNTVAVRKPKVLLLLSDEDLLSPTRLEQTWGEIEESRTSKSRVPPQILAARTNILGLIEYFRRVETLFISAVRGAVDFDLLGIVAMGHYRICSDDTVFENHVLNRRTPPGSAVVWLLTRLLGIAISSEILLEGKSLNAQEARALKLVNRVLPADDFEAEATAVARDFAERPGQAISSLVKAFYHANLALPKYLEEVGTGFEDLG